MKIKSLPVIREFELESDPEGQARIKIRQATYAQNSEREQIFAAQEYTFNDEQRGQMTQKFNWTQSQLEMKEIWLTLAGASGFLIEEDGKEPYELFTFVESRGNPRLAVDEQEFYRRLGLLPGEVVREMHQCVREVNVHWKATAEGNV